jgi:hypothetical protein
VDHFRNGDFLGTLHYGTSNNEIKMPDDDLAHLHIVVGAKLRVGESFFLSWVEDSRGICGRTSIWLHASIPLTFSYGTAKMSRISRERIDSMMTAAAVTGGLDLEKVRRPDGARPRTV